MAAFVLGNRRETRGGGQRCSPPLRHAGVVGLRKRLVRECGVLIRGRVRKGVARHGLPGSTEVAPEAQADAGDGEGGKTCGELAVEGTGLLRGDLVLDGDVGSVALYVLWAEPGLPTPAKLGPDGEEAGRVEGAAAAVALQERRRPTPGSPRS